MPVLYYLQVEQPLSNQKESVTVSPEKAPGISWLKIVQSEISSVGIFQKELISVSSTKGTSQYPGSKTDQSGTSSLEISSNWIN